MSAMTTLFLAIVALVGAPLAGGLVAGLDRRLTARLQSRFGPPILQPFYDLAKLFGKQSSAVNGRMVFCAAMYAFFAAAATVLLFIGSDLLLIFFVQAVGSAFLIMGALSAPSPYSQVGGQRELLQVLAYEPILILVFVAIWMVTGSFEVSAVFEMTQPLLVKLPLAFLALGFALTIKLRKSPFDLSTSHHGHQELVKGMLTEYAGPYLGLIELAHFYEVILVLGLCGLFWATSPWGMALLLIATYVAEILVDNASARMTWRWMLGKPWLVAFALILANILWLAVEEIL